MTGIASIRTALAGAAPPAGYAWLESALAAIAARPAAIGRLFPAAGRHCGRSPLSTVDGWTLDEAARAVLIAALPLTGDALAAEVEALYRYGDAAEKRAVLKALPLIADRIGDAGVALSRDALRTNDTRLVAAALGPYAARLDAAAWRQGVLKCVFMGVPLEVVADLDTRGDADLAVMLAGLADERHAAGRTMPADATALLTRLAKETAA